MAEVTAVQPAFRSPVPDRSGHYLAYIHAVGPGRSLFIYDLAGGPTRQIPTTNDVSAVFGWSPDHRYLAFAQAPPRSPREDDSQAAAWLTLYDLEAGSVQRLGTNLDVQENGAAWLGRHTLFYSDHNLGSNYTEKFIVDLDAPSVKKVRNYLSDYVLAGTNLAVYFKDGNLQTCALDTTNYPPVRPLSHFPPKMFDLIRWLQFRADTGTFLFCARQTNSQWRCLYEFNPATQELKQLTTRGTYNGQCLGAGFAFVGNTNNEFYLGIRPAAAGLGTNLFLGGNVITYAASADGTHVYAVAAAGLEPPGLWDYDVMQRKLRQLVGGQTQPWQAAQLVVPRPKWTRSFDNLVIPYFVVPPAELVKNPQSKQKFPVMLYLPPATWQFQRGFDLTAQFYANLNYWYLPVNYRGGDGYGRAYSDQKSTPNAAKDALAVLSHFGTNANVDLQRVIIISESNGADVALELLKNSTNLWRGAILQHPENGAVEAAGLAPDSPPLFIVTGDLDRAANGLNKFTAEAKKLGIPIELVVQKNTGHEVWSTDQVRDTLKAEWKFIGEWME